MRCWRRPSFASNRHQGSCGNLMAGQSSTLPSRAGEFRGPRVAPASRNLILARALARDFMLSRRPDQFLAPRRCATRHPTCQASSRGYRGARTPPSSCRGVSGCSTSLRHLRFGFGLFPRRYARRVVPACMSFSATANHAVVWFGCDSPTPRRASATCRAPPLTTRTKRALCSGE